jgi:hypothetical protein
MFAGVVKDIDATPYPDWAYLCQLSGGTKLLRVSDIVHRKPYESRTQAGGVGTVIYILAHVHSSAGVLLPIVLILCDDCLNIL